jgi:hypothetical protein
MDNRLTKYLLYAIGEIVLVVIGILIALQINNANELRKQREKEVHYLTNIRNDLRLNIQEIDRYIETRSQRIASAQSIIEHFEGKPLTDLDKFNKEAIDIYTWKKFFQSDNTFQELRNSGNLGLISNEAIKDGLLDLDNLYKKLKYEEDHFRYDAEIMLYEPSYKMLDLQPLVQNYTYQMTQGQAGSEDELPRQQFDNMLKDTLQKNGFVMAVYEFSVMNQQLAEMKAKCDELIVLIQEEIQEDSR